MVLPDRIPFWQSSDHTPKRHLVALSMEGIKLIEGVRLQLVVDSLCIAKQILPRDKLEAEQVGAG